MDSGVVAALVGVGGVVIGVIGGAFFEGRRDRGLILRADRIRIYGEFVAAIEGYAAGWELQGEDWNAPPELEERLYRSSAEMHLVASRQVRVDTEMIVTAILDRDPDGILSAKGPTSIVGGFLIRARQDLGVNS